MYPSKLINFMDREALIWLAALVYLAVIKPGANQHFGFCLVKRMGVKRCPGCGVGRSVSYLLHGEVRRAFEAHPLGIFALVVLVARIVKLLLSNFSPV